MSDHGEATNNYTIDPALNGPLLSLAVATETVLGIAINLFVIVFTLSHPSSLKKPSILFLTSLTLANLLLLVFFTPFTAITAATGEWIFGRTQEEKEITCNFVSFMFGYSIGIATHTLALISFDRFLYLVLPLAYSRYMKTWVAVTALIILWIVVGSYDIPPFVGFGKYDFSYSTASCLLVWNGQRKFVLFFTVIGSIPYTTIFVTQLLVFVLTRNHIHRWYVRHISLARSQEAQEAKQKLYTKKILNLVGLFGSLVLVNILCYLPYMVVSFVFLLNNDMIPSPVYAAVLVLFLMSNILNPLVQSYFRQDLREFVIHQVKRGRSCCCVMLCYDKRTKKASDTEQSNTSNISLANGTPANHHLANGTLAQSLTSLA